MAATAGAEGRAAAGPRSRPKAQLTVTVEPKTTAAEGAGAEFDAAARCSLTVEQTEGPYYFDVDSIRSDIREDREGTLLQLALRVRDAGSCQPIENAVVDIWHADAEGAYSGFEAASNGGPGGGGGPSDEETYLRGAQATNREGIAEFKTIYPGPYSGRTVHIHAKVHLDKRTLLTTQLYFDDAVTTAVIEDEPYASGGGREVRNADDAIYDDSLVLTTKRVTGGFRGLMTIDVERA